MSNHEWRWADPAGQQRLVRTDELRAALSSGVIPANAPVWRRGWTEWQPAHDVPELTTSALSAANGVLLNVPPPPLFVVAAQSEFEGASSEAESEEEEPPLPPKYVPMAAAAPPAVPPKVPESKPKIDDTKTVVDSKVAPKVEASPKPALIVPKPPEPVKAKAREPMKIPAAPIKASVKTAPMTTTTSPKPAQVAPATTARAAAPFPGPPPGSEMRSIPTMRGIPIIPDPTKVPKIEMPNVEGRVAAPLPKAAPVAADAPSAVKRATLPVFPAPPPMHHEPVSARHVEVPKAPPSPAPTPAAQAEPAAPSRNPTLIQFGGAPESTAPPPPAGAAPINVPPPEPSEVTGGSVTRPPPWGEGSVGMQPDIPKSLAAPKIAPENVEELSGSMLLPDSIPPPLPNRPVELSSSDLTSEVDIVVAKAVPLSAGEKRGGTLMGVAPPLGKAKPLGAPTPEAEAPSLPEKRAEKRSSIPPAPPEEETPEPRVAARALDLRQLARDRPPWFLASAGLFGGLILIGLVGVVIRVANGGSESGTVASASSTATTTTTASVMPTVASVPTAITTTTAPTAAKPVDCSLAGKPKTIWSKAMIGSGVEARATAGGVALTFASGPKDGTMTLIDPATLNPTSTTHAKAADTIRRVVALKSGVAIDVDRKGDKLQGRRTVVADPPIDLGSDGSNLAWAAHGTDKTISLWPLGGTGPVESLRAEHTDSATFVAFRQGASIYVGAFGGNPPAPMGALSKIDGLGPKVGSPAVAASGDHAFIVWADRASDGDPWSLRYVVAQSGKAAPEAKKFDVPPGGLGEHAMSPGVSALASGQFLLLWTEGPTSNHQVRAIVLDPNGASRGEALTVSADGVNAGQGQASVQADGKGVVAFLAGSGKTFDIVASGIACTEK